MNRYRTSAGGIHLGVSAMALIVGLVALPASALAQDEAAAAATDNGSQPAEIIVTGSRIARSGFTTPTPVTVIGDEQIARQGAANIAQVLNEIPAFRAQSTPATSAIFVSNLGASTADLRGLGGNRTLVLVDGRRVVASTVSGGSFTPANTVDLNLIPSTLIERVETVTGGASAVYGSDAVAGVVNIIINRNLEGLRGTIQNGVTGEGDDQEFLASLAYGTHFSEDRGRFVIGAEYVNNRGAGDCYSRDWCAENYNTINIPFITGSTTERVFAGQPATLIVPNVRTATSSINGIIQSGPLRGTEFRPDGTTFQHDYGQYAGVGIFQGGGGDSVLPFYQFFPLSTPSERINVFSNLDYDVTDNLRLFVQGSYGRVKGHVLGASRRDVGPGAYVIQRDNAFLPAEVGTAMDEAGITSFNFGRIWNDIGPQLGVVKRETYRAVGGFDWSIGGSWKLDGYYQYGQTDYKQRGYNTTVNSRMKFAVDAVEAPDGSIVCRAVLLNNPAAAGCQPLNPFGSGAGSPEAFDYVTATSRQDTTLKQHVAALTLRGNIVDLWAGPLGFAGGVEYRKEEVTGTTDPISAANDFHTSPGGGIVGGKASLNVKEGFLEVNLPLARDLPFARSAELSGALRVTDYSNSGQVETWKVGVDWEPIKGLRFRGTRSRDIRAPNIFELYGAPQSSFQSVQDGRTGTQFLVPTLLGGNPDLKPEIADTWTAGVIVSPDFGSAGSLRMSADWFDISLDGAISTLGGQVIVDRCNAGNLALCALVDRAGGDPNGAITQIRNYNLNLNTLITRGWDIEAQYMLPLSSISSSWKGRMTFRVLGTFVKDFITIDSAGVSTDRAGMNGSAVSQPSGLPDYTINAYVTYDNDPFSAQLQLRYISSGVYNVSNVGPGQDGYDPLKPNSISDNSVGGVAYVNLNAQYTVWEDGDRSVQMFGVINNLFDKDPPNNLPSSYGPTNNVLYDVLGRSYRVGVRFAL